MLLPTISLKIERWKFNKDYGIYVSTLGNFKDRYKRPLPIKIEQNGYCKVKTEAPNTPWKLAHRIVMLTWKPIPDAENLTVDHLNHNKRDNSLNNLEWVTLQENLRRARKDYYNESEHSLSLSVKMEDKKFLNLDEAVEYLIKKENMIDANQNHIKNRILNAIKNNKKYCGKSWRYA